jgi:ribonucleoside-diphosphate reductase alpha chain
MLGLTYGDERSVELAGEIARTLCHAAYSASVELAEERGRFPFLDPHLYLRGDFVRRSLPGDLLAAIRRHGIRNSHLLAVAAGTISLLAGGISNGIEPVFAFTLDRTNRGAAGEPAQYRLSDPAWREWRRLHGEGAALPDCFVTAADIAPRAHLEVQGAVQHWVDGAVSKTVNLPSDLPFSEFETLFFQAYDLGLKGCTTFRANPARGSVMSAQVDSRAGAHCCSIEREAD